MLRFRFKAGFLPHKLLDTSCTFTTAFFHVLSKFVCSSSSLSSYGLLCLRLDGYYQVLCRKCTLPRRYNAKT